MSRNPNPFQLENNHKKKNKKTSEINICSLYSPLEELTPSFLINFHKILKKSKRFHSLAHASKNKVSRHRVTDNDKGIKSKNPKLKVKEKSTSLRIINKKINLTYSKCFIEAEYEFESGPDHLPGGFWKNSTRKLEEDSHHWFSVSLVSPSPTPTRVLHDYNSLYNYLNQ
ncbi:hypothetical protein ABFS82_03G116300 [Erythranthe guttata]